jgi:hypothetical protein
MSRSALRADEDLGHYHSGKGEPMSSRSSAGRPGLVGAAALAAAAVGLLIGAVGGLKIPDILGSETRDRSSDVVLLEMKNLSEYHAASAELQVGVDLEKDVKHVPSVLAGERAFYLAQGSVDGYIEFSDLNADAIQSSGDHRSVTVTLPPALLSKPRLDVEESRLLYRNRGVLDRVGSVFSDNPTSEKELQIEAVRRLAAAARQSELRERTEENTRTMLTGMMRGFGYENVTVKFEGDAQT